MIYKDGYIHYNTEILSVLVRIAKKNDIPFQRGVFPHFASDALSLMRGDVKPCCVAFPTRYTHSPFEMVQESDLESTVELLYQYVITE